MTTTKRISVNWIAFMQRLNRHLGKEGKSVMKVRQQDDYYILDTEKNELIKTKLSASKLEQMARDLGLIQAWEEVQR
jgi:hypothetical protein